MKKQLIAFGASSSKNSINKKFANYAAQEVKDATVDLLDLNDYEMPIYSIDKENENGIPQLAFDFKQKLKESDGIVISFAEHNGAYTAAFKNIMDWISRIDKKTWEDKPMFLLSTSPGGRGGATVLDIAKNKFKFMNPSPQYSFSLPFFNKNFSEQNGIIDTELAMNFQKELKAFEGALMDVQQVA